MTAQEFINTLAKFYCAMDDDESISIGHWRRPGLIHPELPDFCADVCVTVGELKRMSLS